MRRGRRVDFGSLACRCRSTISQTPLQGSLSGRAVARRSKGKHPQGALSGRKSELRSLDRPSEEPRHLAESKARPEARRRRKGASGYRARTCDIRGSACASSVLTSASSVLTSASSVLPSVLASGEGAERPTGTVGEFAGAPSSPVGNPAAATVGERSADGSQRRGRSGSAPAGSCRQCGLAWSRRGGSAFVTSGRSLHEPGQRPRGWRRG